MAAELQLVRRRILTSTLAVLCAGLVSAFAPLPAQQAGRITFLSIHAAETSSYLDLEQERRVFEPLDGVPGSGDWITAQEHLRIAPDNQGDPRFALELLGIQGASLSAVELQARRTQYDRHAGYLFLNGSFRIEDPALATQNYFLFSLGPVQRLGRMAEKVAVLPLHFGVNPWILDVDSATGYPLYRAEFDSAGRMVSELEVTRFDTLDPNLVPRIDWWAPSLRIEHYATIQDALDTLPAAAVHLPDPTDLPVGFQLSDVRVVHEDLAYEPSVVTTWSDGIDEIFVVVTLNAMPPPLPDPVPGNRPVYALYAYQDLNVGQYLFHTNGVRHMVLGRAGQLWAGGLALELLTRSVSN